MEEHGRQTIFDRLVSRKLAALQMILEHQDLATVLGALIETNCSVVDVIDLLSW